MKLKTLKDLLDYWENICEESSRNPAMEAIRRYDKQIRQEAIKVFLDILKHNKNPFKAFMEFFNLDAKEFI